MGKSFENAKDPSWESYGFEFRWERRSTTRRCLSPCIQSPSPPQAGVAGQIHKRGGIDAHGFSGFLSTPEEQDMPYE